MLDRIDFNILSQKLHRMGTHPVLIGSLLFLIMVNGLSVSPDTVKFVDDTTIWEIIRKSQTFSSVLAAQINECTNWVSQNNMKLNPQKTKEIQVCYSSSDTEPPLPVTINGHEITLVPHAKLLGVIISKDLKRVLHVDYICKKAANKLQECFELTEKMFNSYR